MPNYRAVFRCTAGCHGDHSIWQPIYHCPQCGGLLQVVHDIDPVPGAGTWIPHEGYKVELVATAGAFRLPVNIAFVPNPGTAPNSPFYYVSELYGSIELVTRDGQVSTYATGLLDYNPSGPISGSGEQGLTGITVDPATGEFKQRKDMPYANHAGVLATAGGIIVTALSLDWLAQYSARLSVPPGAALAIVDRNGTYLARYPDNDRFVGRRMPDDQYRRADHPGDRPGYRPRSRRRLRRSPDGPR